MCRSLHSFTFFIKERGVLCVFYVLYKRMRRSLSSFTFFIKEGKRTLRSFCFHNSYKNDQISQKKEWKRTVHSFLRLKNNLTFFFAIYIFIYIYLYISIHIYVSVYIYIYLYISIYIYWRKKTQLSAFFCKRTKHSCVLLRS